MTQEQFLGLKPENIQVQQGTLLYRETIHVSAGQEILIDDLTKGPFSLDKDLLSLAKDLPQLQIHPLAGLNESLIAALKSTQDANEMSPEDIVYLIPGGGGLRLYHSLQELGFYMPNHLPIQVERITQQNGQKGAAQVQTESLEEINSITDLQNKHIIVIDDAINGGGTLKAIHQALQPIWGQTRKNNRRLLLAAAPIRFSIPAANNGEVYYGVEDYDFTLASSVVTNEDPTRSADLTFLSSIVKRDPAEDKRLKRMSEKWGMDVPRLFIPIANKYLEAGGKREEYMPTDHNINQLIRVLSLVVDSRMMGNLLRDLLTLPELNDVGNRLLAAMYLLSGKSIRQVSAEVGLSIPTITRINFWVEHGCGGYKDVYQVLQDDNEPI